MTDRVGEQLGNYRLIRLLGQGGFADVYLGEHLHLGTHAAIKVLHTRLAPDDLEGFRNEARTIARLEHPHIVRVLEFGIEAGVPFLVMSYAPNGSLRQRHSKGVPLPLSTIVSYVRQIADALQYAHDEKVIHRDVKPENMLVGRRHEVLLCYRPGAGLPACTTPSHWLTKSTACANACSSSTNSASLAYHCNTPVHSTNADKCHDSSVGSLSVASTA